MKVFSLTRRLNALTTTQNIRKNFRNCETGQVYSEQRLLGYSCEQMFSVVSEVEKYHSFVPYCKKSLGEFYHTNICKKATIFLMTFFSLKFAVRTKKEDGTKIADLVVGFPPIFGESYTSTVTCIEPYLVTAVCTDMSMFKHLKTVWKFKPVKDRNGNGSENGGKNLQKCQLDFAVAFEFRNNVHSYASRLFFDEIIKKNVLAFLSQAELRYGRESIPRQRPIVYAKQ